MKIMVCIYHQWTNKNTSTNKLASAVAKTNGTTTAYVLTEIHAKDELSTTHILNTLCILDTSDPNEKLAATDMLINLTYNLDSTNSTIPNADPNQGLYPSPIQIGTQYRSTVCFDWSELKTV